METSLLNKILNRLGAMQHDTTSTQQERRFEVDGQPRAKVCYNQKTHIFTVEDYSQEETSTLEFDNIDYAAIEIFELVQPMIKK
ncbi:DUF1797 family protein [Allofustis seminis]|uniref:DUF1797 family protein n=1 Tax=Allofustis seminis TaxID=166939 RepID=UPI0003813E43|nr:DUF1797 family protein [Allofustis seminis]